MINTEDAIQSLLNSNKLNYLVGIVMKKTRGTADPMAVKKTLVRLIIMDEISKKHTTQK